MINKNYLRIIRGSNCGSSKNRRASPKKHDSYKTKSVYMIYIKKCVLIQSIKGKTNTIGRSTGNNRNNSISIVFEIHLR